MLGELAGGDDEFAEAVHVDEGGEVFGGCAADIELGEVGAFEMPEVGNAGIAQNEGVDGEDT